MPEAAQLEASEQEVTAKTARQLNLELDPTTPQYIIQQAIKLPDWVQMSSLPTHTLKVMALTECAVLRCNILTYVGYALYLTIFL